eukprot:EG_transcript_26989
MVSGRLPRLVAFDLDATVWFPEMCHLYGGGAPFSVLPNGNVQDRNGTEVYLMGDARRILHTLKTAPEWADTKVAYCSGTDEPGWARELMRKIDVGDGITLEEVADYMQIRKGTKDSLFRAIQEQSDVPFEEMLFFDNETPNIRSVAPLGVTTIYCPKGLTADVWDRGLQEFAGRRTVK